MVMSILSLIRERVPCSRGYWRRKQRVSDVQSLNTKVIAGCQISFVTSLN